MVHSVRVCSCTKMKYNLALYLTPVWRTGSILTLSERIIREINCKRFSTDTYIHIYSFKLCSWIHTILIWYIIQSDAICITIAGMMSFGRSSDHCAGRFVCFATFHPHNYIPSRTHTRTQIWHTYVLCVLLYWIRPFLPCITSHSISLSRDALPHSPSITLTQE